jgi:plasmid stabilization system protein ParE
VIPIVLRPAAAADIESAMLWYEGQSPGLGADFLTAVDAALHRIRRHPAIFAKIHRDARRVLIHKYPYMIVYRVYPDPFWS